MDPACNTEENEKCFETPRAIGSSEFDLAAVGQQEVLIQCKVNRCYFFLVLIFRSECMKDSKMTVSHSKWVYQTVTRFLFSLRESSRVVIYEFMRSRTIEK